MLKVQPNNIQGRVHWESISTPQDRCCLSFRTTILQSDSKQLFCKPQEVGVEPCEKQLPSNMPPDKGSPQEFIVQVCATCVEQGFLMVSIRSTRKFPVSGDDDDIDSPVAESPTNV